MAEVSEYLKAMEYEVLIRRAFKSHGHTKYKDDAFYMSNLMDAEKGKNNVAHLPSFDKQFLVVQDSVDKALEKFLSSSFRMKSSEKEKISALKNKLSEAYSTADLSEIIEHAVEITNPYK